MDARRRSRGWAVIVGIVVLTAGIGWAISQGAPGGPAQFAREYPFYRGPGVDRNLGQIRIIARDRHGQPVPGAECTVERLQQQRGELFPVAGADGDWVAYNLTPGAVVVSAHTPGYVAASEGYGGETIAHEGGGLTVELTLLRGAQASGRVVDGDTGLPIQGASVSLPGWHARTDREGRYTADAVEPSGEDPSRVSVTADGYLMGMSDEVRFEHEKTCAIPDIHLVRGGFIVGQIARPEKAGEDVYFHASAGTEKLREDGLAYLAGLQLVGDEGAFRVGAIPEGTHTLLVRASNSPGKTSTAELIQNPRDWDRVWEARKPGVKVKAGEETDVGTVELELVSEERVHDGWAQ